MSIYQAPDLSNTVVLTTGYSLPNLSETTILVGQYVNYTRPSYNTADVTWQNVGTYTQPEHTTADASWFIERELQGNISLQNFISSIGEVEHYTCNKPWEIYTFPESNSVNFDFRCATELTVIPESNVNFTWADIRVYGSGNINLSVSVQGELLYVSSLYELAGEISLPVTVLGVVVLVAEGIGLINLTTVTDSVINVGNSSLGNFNISPTLNINSIINIGNRNFGLIKLNYNILSNINIGRTSSAEFTINVNINSFILHKIALSGNLLFNLFSNGAAYLKGNGDVVQVVSVKNLFNKADVINPEIFDVYPKLNEFGLNTINYIKVGELTKLKLKNFNFYNLDNLTKDIVDIFYESGFASGSSFNCNCQTATKTILRNKSLGAVYNVDGSWYSEYIPDTFTLKLEDNNLINVPKKDTLVIVSEDYTEWNVERRLLVKFKIPNFCKYFYNFLKLDGFNEPEYISNIYEAILDFCEPLIYFTSEIYPVHSSDDITANTVCTYGSQYKSPEDWLNGSCILITGALNSVVTYGSYTNYGNISWDNLFDFNNSRESEWLSSYANLVSGVLTVTVAYKSYLNFGSIIWDNVFDFNNSANAEWLEASCSLNSGSMVVTAGYISYNNYQFESLESSCTLISGSLT